MALSAADEVVIVEAVNALYPNAADPSSVLDQGIAQRETFNSAYLTLFQTFGRFGVQLGVRAEQANTELIVPTGESYGNDYSTIFPTGNIRYELGEGKELRLAYSKRIRRPSPWVQNPIDRSTDPLNRFVGNPDIEPVYNHNFSFEAAWNGSVGMLRLSPYLRRSVGDWAQIKTVDAEGISTVTWENLNSVNAYGASLTANLRPSNGIGGYVSVSGQRVTSSGSRSRLPRERSASDPCTCCGGSARKPPLGSARRGCAAGRRR
mgnify:CR=1 FL=1